VGANGEYGNECVITHKVYDSCRKQDCLTHKNMGPSRAAECCAESEPSGGGIVRPSQKAISVTISELKIKNIYVPKKHPNPFKKDFWDLSVSFVFEYFLTFWGADGCIINSIEANSVFNTKITLCGGKDPFNDTAPYFWIGAKAIDIDAKIYRNPKDECKDEVRVKIALFSEIKLLRQASLILSSKGFCEPKDYEPDIDPCEYFKKFSFAGL